jgi:hypothetical protein
MLGVNTGLTCISLHLTFNRRQPSTLFKCLSRACEPDPLSLCVRITAAHTSKQSGNQNEKPVLGADTFQQAALPDMPGFGKRAMSMRSTTRHAFSLFAREHFRGSIARRPVL